MLPPAQLWSLSGIQAEVGCCLQSPFPFQRVSDWCLTVCGFGRLMRWTPTHIYIQSHLPLLSPPCIALSLFQLRLELPQVLEQSCSRTELKSFQRNSHAHVFKGEDEFFNYVTFLFGAIAFNSCSIIFLLSVFFLLKASAGWVGLSAETVGGAVVIWYWCLTSWVTLWL